MQIVQKKIMAIFDVLLKGQADEHRLESSALGCQEISNVRASETYRETIISERIRSTTAGHGMMASLLLGNGSLLPVARFGNP